MDKNNIEEYNKILSNFNEINRNMILHCDKMYKKFCDDHFCVLIGGKFFIATKSIDENGYEKIQYLTKKDFLDYYENLKFYEAVKYKEKHVIREYSTAKRWIRSFDRQTYEGVIFNPEKNVEGMYNTWKGFFISGKEGSWNMIRNHFYEVWCRENDEYFNYLMKWFAHLIQYPGVKPSVAIVIKGEKGTGKSMIVDKIFSKILGNMYIPISKSHHVIGKFNYQLDGKLLLLMEEAVWAGDKASEGAIKTLITEDKIAIEAKGVDTVIKNSYLRVMYISNEKRAVPATMDERRFFALTTSSKYKGDYKYFEELSKAIDEEIPAFMFYLENLELGTRTEIFNVPKTETLFEDIVEGMDSVYRWLYDFIVICQNGNGSLLNAPIRTSVLWQMFQKYLKDERDFSSYKPNSEVKSHKKLTTILKNKLGYKHIKIKQHYFIDFGGIENAKKAFESICKYTTWEKSILDVDILDNYSKEYNLYNSTIRMNDIKKINEELEIILNKNSLSNEVKYSDVDYKNYTIEEYASKINEQEDKQISKLELNNYEQKKREDVACSFFKSKNNTSSNQFEELERLIEEEEQNKHINEFNNTRKIYLSKAS